MKFTMFETRVKALPWIARNNETFRIPHEEMFLRLTEMTPRGIDADRFRAKFLPDRLRAFADDFGEAGLGGFDWFFSPAESGKVMTKSAWESEDWNPGLVGRFAAAAGDREPDAEKPDWMSDELWDLKGPAYAQPDPAASPKPSWDELLYAFASWGIDRGAEQQTERLAAAVDRRETADALRTVSLGGESLHAGHGIDHMTGLVHMAERATTAGIDHPLVVMRKDAGDAHPLWLQREIREVLGEAVERRNIEESARNVVHGELSKLAAVRDSRTAPVAEKIAAFNKANAILGDYDNRIEAEKVKVAARTVEELPLDPYKEKMLERLEAVGMAKVKAIKGVHTQQGVDLPPSCIDEANALEAVAREQRLGAIEIARTEPTLWKKDAGAWAESDDDPATVQHEGDGDPDDLDGADGEYYRESGIDDAKAAFDAAIAEIEDVQPLNVPEWSYGGNTLDGSDLAIDTGRPSLVVTVTNPTGVAGSILARASGVVIPAGGLQGRQFRKSQSGRVDFTLPTPKVSGESVVYEMTASNLCGPAKTFRLTLTRS